MKKSQIKFGESIAILVIMYFIILIGLFWYDSYLQGKTDELRQKQNNLANEKVFFFIENLDILRVSDFGSVKSYYDYNSLVAFKNIINSSDKIEFYIIDNLGYSKINLTLLDADFSKKESLILYDNEPENFRNKKIYNKVITVRKIEDNFYRNYLGIIRLEIFTDIIE